MKHATRLAKGFGGAAKALVAAIAIALTFSAVADPSSWTSYETIDGIKWSYEFVEDHVAIVALGGARRPSIPSRREP